MCFKMLEATSILDILYNYIVYLFLLVLGLDKLWHSLPFELHSVESNVVSEHWSVWKTVEYFSVSKLILQEYLSLIHIKGQKKATASCHTPNRVYTK